MKRLVVFFLLAPLVALLTLAGGCAKKEGDDPADKPKGTFGSRAVVAGGESRAPLTAPLDGVIKGRVVYKGPAQKPEIIKPMFANPTHAACLDGAKEFELVDPTWMIGTDGAVANVVISLKPPGGKYFKIDQDKLKKLEGTKVVVDQPHCAFIPHVRAAFPSYYDGKTWQPTGEQFIVKNSAPFTHNTNWKANTLKTGNGNVLISPNTDLTINLVPDSDPILLACNIHDWMNARVWAFDHPYFDVTKADGTFEIKDVPTGVELGLVAWHEAPGFFHGGKDGVKHTFKPGENKLPDLEVSPK